MTFALTAYFGSFKIRQHQVRKEMKTLIKAGAPDSLHHYFYLDEIESDPSQITWIHSKEFRYRGEMYDILTSTKENGRVLLHCIHDVKESGLFAELDRMVDKGLNGDPQQRNQKLHWHKLFHSLFLSDSTSDVPFAADVLNQLSSARLSFKLMRGMKPPVPPPQFVV